MIVGKNKMSRHGKQLTNDKELADRVSDSTLSYGFRIGCQMYHGQQSGVVICPSGAVSTWAILFSLVADGLGLVVSAGQVHWSPNMERRRP